MSFAETIAALTVSLPCIRCSGGDAGPNYPGSTENEFSLLFDGVDGHGKHRGFSGNPEFEDGRNSMQVRLHWIGVQSRKPSLHSFSGVSA